MWVRSLGREDLLEYKMVTHSSILAWNIPWTEEPEGLQSMGSQESRVQVLESTDQESDITERLSIVVSAFTEKKINKIIKSNRILRATF